MRLAQQHYRASSRDRHPATPVAHGSWLRGGRGPFVIYHECGFARYATAAGAVELHRPERTMGFAPRLRGETIARMHARIIAIAFLSIVREGDEGVQLGLA